MVLKLNPAGLVYTQLYSILYSLVLPGKKELIVTIGT